MATQPVGDVGAADGVIDGNGGLLVGCALASVADATLEPAGVADGTDVSQARAAAAVIATRTQTLGFIAPVTAILSFR